MTKNERIRAMLIENPLVPVAKFNDWTMLEKYVSHLKETGVDIIELTLRTPNAMSLLEQLIAADTGLKVGVGTVVTAEQYRVVAALDVDFIVSPGLTKDLYDVSRGYKIPFLPGVATPSEVMRAISFGFETLKFFPAGLNGGTKTLKLFGALYPDVKFCPTGGVNQDNHQDYLELDNVVAIGGSYLQSDEFR